MIRELSFLHLFCALCDLCGYHSLHSMSRQPVRAGAVFDFDGHVMRQRQGGLHGFEDTGHKFVRLICGKVEDEFVVNLEQVAQEETGQDAAVAERDAQVCLGIGDPGAGSVGHRDEVACRAAQEVEP